MKLAPLLLCLSGCIITVEPAVPPPCPPAVECPPPQVVYVLNPNLRQMGVFWQCMKGPGVRLDNIPGEQYIPCDWLTECAGMDKDQDGYLDLKDYSMWQASVGK